MSIFKQAAPLPIEPSGLRSWTFTDPDKQFEPQYKSQSVNPCQKIAQYIISNVGEYACKYCGEPKEGGRIFHQKNCIYYDALKVLE